VGLLPPYPSKPIVTFLVLPGAPGKRAKGLDSPIVFTTGSSTARTPTSRGSPQACAQNLWITLGTVHTQNLALLSAAMRSSTSGAVTSKPPSSTRMPWTLPCSTVARRASTARMRALAMRCGPEGSSTSSS